MKPLMIVVGLLAAGCGDHASSYVTTPPSMPNGYGVAFDSTYGQYTSVNWKRPGAILWDKTVVSHNVLRVGVQKAVIFGIREDPKTKTRSAFWVDTNLGQVVLDIPEAELTDRPGEAFGIKGVATVPARFYSGNCDGGPR